MVLLDDRSRGTILRGLVELRQWVRRLDVILHGSAYLEGATEEDVLFSAFVRDQWNLEGWG